MRSKMVNLESLDRESIYIPFNGLGDEKKILQSEWKAYTAYTSMMYREHKVWIQPFINIDIATNNKPVYFHMSHYIPYLKNHRYTIKEVNGSHLIDYLRNVDGESYVIISVKDDGSQQITEEVFKQLQSIGITKISKDNLRFSYIWVARKVDQITYEVIHEECSSEDLLWEGNFGEEQVSVKSGGANASNYSSITLNEKEWSHNQRGFNILKYNHSSGVQSIVFDTFATLYEQGSLFKAVPNNIQENESFRMVSHAGGRISGVDYTNCKEAIEHNYAVKGHRVFEIDFELTSDEELVARHDWEPYLYKVLRQLPPEGIDSGEALTLEQFLNLKVLDKYSPMTIHDLYQFMIDHPDSYLVTDSKHTDPKVVEKQFKKLVDAAEPFGYNVLLRIIPQLYNEEMYEVIERVFPFPRYAYTLYQTKATDDEVCNFVKEKKIEIVTIYPERYTADFGEELKKYGAKVFIHTINDIITVREYLQMNVHGFYTDNLSAFEIDKETFGYQVEIDTRRNIMAQYLESHFYVAKDKIDIVLDNLNPRKLTNITQSLFESQTADEVLSLLQET